MAEENGDQPLVYGVVGVIVHQAEWLVIKRSELVQAPGRFCFPGGGIESGEGQRQALVRELREELRVEATPDQRLWSSTTSWGVHLTWWQATLNGSPTDIDINLLEVAEARWMAPESIAELPGLLESNLEFLAAWEKGQFTLR